MNSMRLYKRNCFLVGDTYLYQYIVCFKCNQPYLLAQTCKWTFVNDVIIKTPLVGAPPIQLMWENIVLKLYKTNRNQFFLNNWISRLRFFVQFIFFVRNNYFVFKENLFFIIWNYMIILFFFHVILNKNNKKPLISTKKL